MTPQFPGSEAITDVMGSDASFFPAGTSASAGPGAIFLPDLADVTFEPILNDDIAAR